MHVYLREEPVRIVMREVDADGLTATEAGLVPIAFFADDNESPSFRALLPGETLGLLERIVSDPVHLGLMAEEPEDPAAEVQAMVGLTVPVDELPEGMIPPNALEDDDEDAPPLEPWQSAPPSAGEAWRGDLHGSGQPDRMVLLAFAPLVRLSRRHPENFGEELADLLESALAGATKPSLEARVDRMLGL